MPVLRSAWHIALPAKSVTDAGTVSERISPRCSLSFSGTSSRRSAGSPDTTGSVSLPSASHLSSATAMTVSSNRTRTVSPSSVQTATTCGQRRSADIVTDELALPGVPPEGSTEGPHASGSLKGLLRSVSSADHPPPERGPSPRRAGV